MAAYLPSFAAFLFRPNFAAFSRMLSFFARIVFSDDSGMFRSRAMLAFVAPFRSPPPRLCEAFLRASAVFGSATLRDAALATKNSKASSHTNVRTQKILHVDTADAAQHNLPMRQTREGMAEWQHGSRPIRFASFDQS